MMMMMVLQPLVHSKQKKIPQQSGIIQTSYKKKHNMKRE